MRPAALLLVLFSNFAGIACATDQNFWWLVFCGLGGLCYARVCWLIDKPRPPSSIET